MKAATEIALYYSAALRKRGPNKPTETFRMPGSGERTINCLAIPIHLLNKLLQEERKEF
jgi:hypothetical protein